MKSQLSGTQKYSTQWAKFKPLAGRFWPVGHIFDTPALEEVLRKRKCTQTKNVV